MADTWYILLNGYADFDGVTLKATYTPVAQQVTTLTNGVALTGLSGASGSQTFYKIDVPASQDFLTIETSGGTGDVDLYVKKGDKPSTTSWDYRPYLVGNNESVSVTNPTAATWYIMLRGYQAYSGLTLKATYGTNHVPPPTTGNNFAGDPNCVALWRFEPGALTADSVSTNNLTNHGADPNSSGREGAGCAHFTPTGGYLDIADTALTSKFPLKNGHSHVRISVCFWFRPKTTTGEQYLWEKYTDAGRSLALYCLPDYFGFKIGIQNGQSKNDASSPNLVPTAGHWYHIAATYNGDDTSYRFRVYDATADMMRETTGSFGQDISVTDAAVTIGSQTDGLIDECAVFNDVLTAGDIDKIRQGTYGR